MLDFPSSLQKNEQTPELETGAVKAILDLYDVMRHDVLSINMRFVQMVDMFFCFPSRTFISNPIQSAEIIMRHGICC